MQRKPVTHDEMETTALRPFHASLAAGYAAVMLAHARYRALDPALPVSITQTVIGGLVSSDDFERVAVAHCQDVEGNWESD